MDQAGLHEAESGKQLLERVGLAQSFGARFRGWMGKSSISPGEGLLLWPCDSIHTFFMKVPIDVVMIGDKGKILGISRNIVPWRAFRGPGGTLAVLETRAHETVAWQEGNRLELRSQTGKELPERLKTGVFG